MKRFPSVAAFVAAVIWLAACSGSSTAPDPTPTPDPTPFTVTTTVKGDSVEVSCANGARPYQIIIGCMRIDEANGQSSFLSTGTVMEVTALEDGQVVTLTEDRKRRNYDLICGKNTRWIKVVQLGSRTDQGALYPVVLKPPKPPSTGGTG